MSSVQEKIDQMKREIDLLEKECKDYFETDDYKKYIQIKQDFEKNPTPFLKSALKALEGRQNVFLEKRNRLDTVKKMYEKQKAKLLNSIYVEDVSFTKEEVTNGCKKKVIFEDGTELLFRFPKNTIEHGKLQFLQEFPKYQVRTYIVDQLDLLTVEDLCEKEIDLGDEVEDMTFEDVSFKSLDKFEEKEVDEEEVFEQSSSKLENSFQLKIKAVEQELREKNNLIESNTDKLAYNKELLNKITASIQLLEDEIEFTNKEISTLQMELDDLKQREFERQKVEKEMKQIDDQIAELLKRKSDLLGHKL